MNLSMFVGSVKRNMTMTSTSKLNKKIGSDVTLSFDMTILKPVDYIKYAE